MKPSFSKTQNTTESWYKGLMSWTSCVKSLGHKDLKSWVSLKSETKNFFWKLRLEKSEKHQRKKNFFVSDFNETQDFKSLKPTSVKATIDGSFRFDSRETII